MDLLPTVDWGTVGTEQGNPDTVNNLLFGHVEATPSFTELFLDPLDDSSSYGQLGASRDDESSGTAGTLDQPPFPPDSDITERGRTCYTVVTYRVWTFIFNSNSDVPHS